MARSLKVSGSSFPSCWTNQIFNTINLCQKDDKDALKRSKYQKMGYKIWQTGESLQSKPRWTHRAEISRHPSTASLQCLRHASCAVAFLEQSRSHRSWHSAWSEHITSGKAGPDSRPLPPSPPGCWVSFYIQLQHTLAMWQWPTGGPRNSPWGLLLSWPEGPSRSL